MSRSKARAGFSLLELVVALGIVAITSGVVMAHWTAPSQERQQLEQDAQRLASTIRYAQQMTVQGVPTRVRISTHYVSIQTLVNPTLFQDRESWRFADGVTMVSFVSARRDFNIDFTARGTPRNSGTITLHSLNYRTYLTINVAGGRVRVGDVTARHIIAPR